MPYVAKHKLVVHLLNNNANVINFINKVHCYQHQNWAQWFFFTLIEKFSLGANMLTFVAFESSGWGVHCFLASIRCPKGHIKVVISKGCHFLSLLLNSHQGEHETFFFFLPQH